MAHDGTITHGDGHALPSFRWWQPLSRSLFHLRLVGEGGGERGADQVWSVDVRHGGDEDGEVRVRLYRNGFHHATAKPPVAFPVPGGVIEVAVSGYGLSRCHYVRYDGSERQLVPDPASAEARRARLERTSPGVSRTVSVASFAVLVVALVLGVPQIVEQITQIPVIAEHIGTFVSPFRLPVWGNIALVVATLAASTERALRLRYNRVLDGGWSGGGDS